MGEQQSQKRGVKSDAQKRDAARHGLDPMPASGPAGGAFGEHAPDKQSDKDAALRHEDGRQAIREKQWSERERSEDV